MARVKRGTISHKRRKHLLKYTKGFRWGRKSKYRLAKQAMQKAWTYAYRDRKKNKSRARALWQTNINAALRALGLSYSKFMGLLKKNNIQLDRKILAQIAKEHSSLFSQIVQQVKEK
jgi:large subunit ribosomal protein L20